MAITIDGDNGISGVNGTANAPALQGNDSDTGIVFGTDEVQIATGGSARATVDSSGRLLIGHTSNYADGGADDLVVGSTGISEQGITIGASTSSQIRFADAGANTAGYILYNHSDDALAFSANGTERARLDSSGRLLVNTSSSSTSQFLQIQGDTGGDDNGGTILLKNGVADSSASSGTGLGGIAFGGSTGNQYCRIEGFADGNGGTNDYPGRLAFSVTRDGESSPTERLRLGNAAEFTLRPHTYGMGVRSVGGSSSVTTAYFGAHSSSSMTTGTITFEVYTNGNVKNTNNSYSQLSDERLKENIINAPSQWDDIKSLQIRKYNFRDGNGYETHTQIGLVAQEVQTVCPGLVQETPVREDATPILDAEGNELEATKSVLTSVLYMKAIKALQEAQTRIETLETKVAALEAAE